MCLMNLKTLDEGGGIMSQGVIILLGVIVLVIDVVAFVLSVDDDSGKNVAFLSAIGFILASLPFILTATSTFQGVVVILECIGILFLIVLAVNGQFIGVFPAIGVVVIDSWCIVTKMPASSTALSWFFMVALAILSLAIAAENDDYDLPVRILIGVILIAASIAAICGVDNSPEFAKQTVPETTKSATLCNITLADEYDDVEWGYYLAYEREGGKYFYLAVNTSELQSVDSVNVTFHYDSEDEYIVIREYWYQTRFSREWKTAGTSCDVYLSGPSQIYSPE